jgi:hypothetical protein
MGLRLARKAPRLVRTLLKQVGRAQRLDRSALKLHGAQSVKRNIKYALLKKCNYKKKISDVVFWAHFWAYILLLFGP